MIDSLVGWFTAERLLGLGTTGIRVVVILVAALVLSRLLRGLGPRIQRRFAQMMGRRREPDTEIVKRADTLSGIVLATARVVTWLLAIVMVLKHLGFDIGPILAGAGVVGLAVGFGAQNLVRDVISGAFILLENQVRTGDVAIINGTGGLVERINLRTIVLRGLDGTVHIFANGTINTLSNMTQEYSYYLFEIGVAYKEDTDRVSEVVSKLAEELRQEEEYRETILEPLEVLGVDKFADSAVIIKARLKTKPIKQWAVGREMNRRIKKKFDELGIEIPFPHHSVYFGEASNAFRLSLERGEDREAIKELVREVVSEKEGAGS